MRSIDVTDKRTFSVEHTFTTCWVGPLNCGNDILLFRAPVVRDGSGTYKRLPHQVEWKHLQKDDVVIAMELGDGPSGQKVLDVLQFWRVLRKEGEDECEVEVNNVVGMSGDGDYVYNQMAALVDLDPESIQ